MWRLRCQLDSSVGWKRDDGGAVVVITAILTMLIAIALLALTVDVGRITYERSQLQNGSDAAALALAGFCGRNDSINCTSNTSTNGLATLADKNANDDGTTDLNPLTRDANDPAVCGVGAPGFPLAALPVCPSPASSAADLTNCLPLPLWASDLPYVETRTRTRTPNGGSILPNFFGQILTGSQGITHMTCSRAAWGAAGGTGNTLPVTMGMCDWLNKTQNGTNYAPAPPYSIAPGTTTSPAASIPPEVKPYALSIFTHDSGSHQCVGSPGQTYPGGFGYASGSSGCTVTISDGSTIPGNPGNAAPTDCKSGVLATWLGKVVAIPIYDSYVGTGSAGTYHIAGIAMFYFAGYDNISAAGPNTASVYAEPSGASALCTGSCGGSESWIWGWFTTGILPVGTIVNGQNFGAGTVAPAG